MRVFLPKMYLTGKLQKGEYLNLCVSFYRVFSASLRGELTVDQRTISVMFFAVQLIRTLLKAPIKRFSVFWPEH